MFLGSVAISSTAANCGAPGTCNSRPTEDSAKAKKNIVSRIIDYFDESNKPKRDKGFDFSVIGGPHYSSDTKFGIGLVAAGLYRTSPADSLLPPSNVAIYADATTSRFFKLGIRGINIFPGDKARLYYDVNIASVKSQFWGIGYENGANDDNESNYKYICSQAKLNFGWRLAKNLYTGPSATFDYILGQDFARPELLGGEDKRSLSLGAGFTLQYDSRDYPTNASRGMYVCMEQRFYPHFLFNDNAFSLTELTLSMYHRVWKGGILAWRIHSRLTYGDTPWGMLSTLGGSTSMRGYFEGRYRDKSAIDACVELRQHVWRRNGLAAWIGGGTIFPRFSAIRGKRLLPNYGIGYRWEFKNNVNIRLDIGFGRGESGFNFSINEAF